MTFDQLRYFIAIAEEQNMTKAAERLNIAQPALSRTLGRMEEELGSTLFDRHGKSITLNSSGQEFLRFARKCVSDLQITRTNILSEEIRGTLRLGNLVENMEIHRVIAAFAGLHPAVDLRIHRVTKIENPSSYDFFFATNAYDVVHMGDKLDSVLLWEEPIGVLVSKSHPLANRTEVSLGELKDYNFVLSLTHEYGNFTKRFFQLANFTPKSQLRTNDPPMMVEAIRATNYVAISPIYAHLYDKHDDFRILKLVNPEYSRKVYMYWDKSRTLSDSEIAFLNFVREYPFPTNHHP